MTALGFVQKHEGAGLALAGARYCKDLVDARKALVAVKGECARIAPRYVGANKSREHGMALSRVAGLALEHYCRTVDTPGAACHPQFCRGRGVIRDMEQSRLHGKPVDKICPRCGGTGLRSIPGASIRRTIEVLLGKNLSRGEWENGWHPLYQAVLAWCHVQESEAGVDYRRVTKEE
ncbi:antitermination protein [Aeromonas hydrophila]|nr:antitermination protein [Aeromonas hydrophila]OFC52671.1 antitermination protein [Aeromonas hydrophila]